MTQRPTLSSDNLHPGIKDKVSPYKSHIVTQVIDAVENNKAVVIGMALNSSVKKARLLLEDNGYDVTYLEFGGYASMWQERLAIKMWSGWPTFPQVFIDGTLIGGASDLAQAIDNESL